MIPCWNILLRFGYENISMAILHLSLIQEEQLSVNGEKYMLSKLVNGFSGAVWLG